jgi:RNA polymerase sigma factor (sigma-70 family)
MHIHTLEDHYIKNCQKLIKRLSYKAGTVWAAEDCVHEAYARAIRYIESCDNDKDFNKWFTTILNNVLIDYKNAERGQIHEYEEEEISRDDCQRCIQTDWKEESSAEGNSHPLFQARVYSY